MESSFPRNDSLETYKAKNKNMLHKKSYNEVNGLEKPSLNNSVCFSDQVKKYFNGKKFFQK